VCEEVLLEVRAAYPEATVRLETRGNLIGQWDSDRLAQVVSNLAGNAVQHGGGTAVSVVAHDDGDAVTVAVHNGGPPISPDVIPFIFEPLGRGQAAGDNPAHSIGLGLFIARAVVSAHGGDIQLRSSGSEGTTFTVRLPRGAAA
jgi:hypothetical protein